MDGDTVLHIPLPEHHEHHDGTHHSLDSATDTAIFMEENEGTSTKRGACCNFINLTVGGGVVGIPKAVTLCGYIPGIIYLTVYAIIASATMLETDSYGCTVRASLGKRAGYTSMCLCLILNVGAIIVGLQVIGHGVSGILLTAGVNNLGLNEIIGLESLSVLLIATVFVLPLSLLRHVGHLELASYFSNMAIVVFVCIITIQGPQTRKAIEDVVTDIPATPCFSNVFADQVLGMNTIVFNYCTGLSLSVGTYRSLSVDRQRLSVWWTVSVISMSCCYVLYMILGLSASIFFGTTVPDDILLIYPIGDVAGACSIGLIAISAILTVPLNIYIVRDVINQAIFVSFLKYPLYSGTIRHAALTMGTWAICVVVAITYKDLLYVIALTGALCGSSIGFLFPPLTYVATLAGAKGENKRKRVLPDAPDWLGLFFPCLSILAGTFGLLLGTIYIIYDMSTLTQPDDGVFAK